MAILGWSVLLLVFVDELLAIAAAAVWGNHVASVWLALGMAALTVLVFTLASVGLWASGHHALAVALFVFSAVINGLAQLPSVKVLVQD
jgi:hypothetical protein